LSFRHRGTETPRREDPRSRSQTAVRELPLADNNNNTATTNACLLPSLLRPELLHLGQLCAQELPITTIGMADLTVGCVVTLNDGRQATVRFVGSTRFATGDWVGVELEDGDGKNDGSVQGERYFECEPGYGMFVRPSIITAIVERPVRAAKPAARPAAPAQGRSRAPSGLSAGPGLRRPGSISSLNTKRQSVGASSPTPVPKGAAQRLSLMVRCLL
jgi:hypothetical protein